MGNYRLALRAAAIAGAVALVFVACGGDTSGPVAVDVSANPELASPVPEAPEDATADTSYAPLDLPSPTVGITPTPEPPVAVDIAMGFTSEGHPFRGNPDATVTVIEYSDYACPFCGRHTAEVAPALLDQYGATGQVRFIFREFPLVGLHPTAPFAHAAAFCAAEQDAALYWAMHDEIFSRQSEWTQLSDPSDFLATLAAEIGVEVAAYEDCLGSDRPGEHITADVAEAQEYGFSGTPSFRLTSAALEHDYQLIGAQPLEVFTAALDAMLAGQPPPGVEVASTEPQPSGLPAWADRTSGLLPDPDQPGVNQAGDQYKGDPDAPIVVIEFSDFQCPFCRQAMGIGHSLYRA